MAIPNVQYYFKPGRLMTNGRTNPGILVVDQVRSFQCNNISKDKSIFNYVCNERLTLGVMCKAKAVVTKCVDDANDPRFILSKVDHEHSCKVNIAKAIADALRHEMKEIVRKEPHKPVSDAIRTVRQSLSAKYDSDEDLFDQIMAELGADKPLEKQLLRVRKEIIGTLPPNRNAFDPGHFLARVFGNDQDVIILDSNLLSPGWRDRLQKTNPNSSYRWEKLDETMRRFEQYDPESQMACEENYDEPTDRDVPKRILAFTTLKLLKLFGKHLKSSVDGTFKSACFLWKQTFVWMIKYYGHWIPVVHAWLPDKTEVSYKVRHSFSYFYIHLFILFAMHNTFINEN